MEWKKKDIIKNDEEKDKKKSRRFEYQFLQGLLYLNFACSPLTAYGYLSPAAAR